MQQDRQEAALVLRQNPAVNGGWGAVCRRVPADEIATLDEEGQLARRHPHDVRVLAPRRREPSALQTFLPAAHGLEPEPELLPARLRSGKSFSAVAIVGSVTTE